MSSTLVLSVVVRATKEDVAEVNKTADDSWNLIVFYLLFS